MDAASGGEGEFVTYAEIEAYFNDLALEGPSAQDRMDCIVPHLISLLPPPFVPAPDADDSDDDHFSVTSSEEDTAAPADGPAVVPAAQDGDGQDHISRLPDDLLSNIVSCLPTNEAARTMVLSTRWRCVWAATPLLVDDAHLSAADGPRNFNAVRALSHCVAAHPGPVRAVRVTRTSFHRQEYALQRLLASLAAKNVQDLVLFNRPWPLDMLLPDEILSCASLTRLYIGVWRFPDTTAHQPAFPNLHELGLFHSIIDDRDVDALLAHCPKLKILSFAITYSCRSRLRIKSSSLRVLMEWRCGFDEIIVEDAPCLERLLFESISDRRPVRIVHAPRLEVLGFLDLRVHALEIGGIIIRAGMNLRARAMLSSLKMLAVRVRFSHDMDVKMLDTLLRCFPRLETLHVMSIRSSSPDGVACGEFWKSLGSCDCLESHLKTFVFHRFRGLDCQCEYLLLCYILTKGKVLKMLGLDCADSDDVVMEGGPVSGSVGEGNAPTGGSSVSDDVVVEGGPMSGSSVGGNVSSGGSSGSDDVVVEGGPMPGSAGEGIVSSGGSSGSDDVVMEGGPVSGSVGEGDAPSGGSTGRNIIHVYPASPSWSFQNAIDLSVEDPFCVLRHDEVWIASRVLA